MSLIALRVPCRILVRPEPSTLPWMEVCMRAPCICFTRWVDVCQAFENGNPTKAHTALQEKVRLTQSAGSPSMSGSAASSSGASVLAFFFLGPAASRLAAAILREQHGAAQYRALFKVQGSRITEPGSRSFAVSCASCSSARTGWLAARCPRSSAWPHRASR